MFDQHLIKERDFSPFCICGNEDNCRSARIQEIETAQDFIHRDRAKESKREREREKQQRRMAEAKKSRMARSD